MRFEEIENYINEQLSKFDKVIPQLEKNFSNSILKELNALQLTKDGSIKRSAANLKKMLSVQRHLSDALTGKKYLNQLKSFFKATGTISDQINQFYKETFKVGTPNSIAKAIREGSRNVIIERMTTGLKGAISDALQPILNSAVMSGESYNSLAEQIKAVVNGNSKNEGLIRKYSKQIATDTLNGYAANYHVAMSEGLGFQWFQYTGANLATTRDFCLACKERKFIHISEFPEIVKGHFKEFKDIGGKIYEKYGLPQGMRLGTNKDNFRLYRGGYNCGHQVRPVYEYMVPKSKREEIYTTTTYKSWKTSQGDKKFI